MISATVFLLGLLVYVEGQRCGYRPKTRIVGGTPAQPGDWPWQAQLTYGSGRHFCGGTLVHPEWILTASHCVDGLSKNNLKIRLGAHRRQGNIGTEQRFNVKKIYMHRSYQKPVSYAYDIAMIKLDRPALLNRQVGLACLPRFGSSLPVGKRCFVTGWGRLQSGGASPDVLMQASVPIVHDRVCERGYPGRMHKSMVCAGYAEGGIDACQGDSGGPLVCETRGKWYIEGAVSWGIGCADPGQYGVYADVRYLMNWVQVVLNQG